ncbi:MAG: hypothetical protein NFCOHLIN_01364 [Gammaproteobacteria bacterium]|nr:hypothetical protein [Gammaproteobacteria bacterium]
MSRPALLLACTALLGLAPAAHAVGSLTDINIHDRTAGQTLPVYYKDGQYFVAGEPGHEYQIQIRNQSGGDVLTVVSVDGVNVVSGETAHWRQSGYVLDDWDSLEIKGWRKSLERTAAFYFTRLPDSYAARTGRPDNVGVIGVAVFQRRPAPTPMPNPAPLTQADEAAPAAGAAGESRQEARSGELSKRERRDAEAARLGTGHGRSETSYARYTTFERATESPAEIIAIRYDSRRNLVAQGVIPAEVVRPLAVHPFPGGFVPDP